jgi:hypothetical protein
MKNIFLMMFVVVALAGCRETVDRCENGELSQEECCASNSKYCENDADADTGTTDAGEDFGMDTSPDADAACVPACTTGVCDSNTKTCVGCAGDGDCSAAKPVCDPNANVCVGCVDSGDCSGDTSVCDTTTKTCVACVGTEGCGANEVCSPTHTCVGCLGDGDCDGDVCDMTTNTCVSCLGDGDCGAEVCKTGATSDLNTCVACRDNTTCTDAAASKCEVGTNTCVGCGDVTDCSQVPNATKYCDAGVCAGCHLETEAADCLINNVQYFCDGSTNTCSNTIAGNAGTCASCNANTDCAIGYRCVDTDFMAATAGSYCMRLSTGQTCPGPYGGGIQARTDLSGAQIDVCMLSESITSCAAYNLYGDICTTNPTACDVAGGVCKQFDVATRRCTYECIFNSDCPNNVTCKTTGIGKFCGAISD